MILGEYKDLSILVPKKSAFLKRVPFCISKFVIMAAVNLDNIQFYNHAPSSSQICPALLYVGPPPIVPPYFKTNSLGKGQGEQNESA